jgi:hypothetical protein
MWFAGAFWGLFPGATFLLEYAPPLWSPLGWLIPVLCMGLLAWSYHREKNAKARWGKAMIFVLATAALITIYWIALQSWTVTPPPPRDGERRQIGFGMAPWSLTPKSIEKIQDSPRRDPPIEISSPNDVMNIFGLWGERGLPTEAWQAWSIFAAGMTLVLLYVAGCVCWAYGLGVLMRALTEP